MTSQESPDVVVIGGGPGGYVAALRAAQLGLSTVCVEMDKTLGGTCVNVGCIPSKALLTSSEHLDFTRSHAVEHGIKLEAVSLDLAQMLRRKDDVVAQNTKGIEFLFRKNKITWAKGLGTLRAGNVVDVCEPGGPPIKRFPSTPRRNASFQPAPYQTDFPFFASTNRPFLSTLVPLKTQKAPRNS